jgi:hypothetical protein
MVSLHTVRFESPWVFRDNEQQHHEDEVYDNRKQGEIATVIDLLLRQSIQCAEQTAQKRLLLLLSSLTTFSLLGLGNKPAVCRCESWASEVY